jgi:uncharacterized repeat protein (TIGR01451 family)
MLPMRRSTLLVLVALFVFLGFGLSMDGLSFHGHPAGKWGENCPVESCGVSPPALALKICVPACASAGEELDYRIIIENRSPTAAHHVVIHNPLPANAKYVRAKPEPAATEPELRWRLGTIAGCSRCEICLTLTAVGVGEIRNCVRITSEHGVCACTNVGAGEAPEQLTIPPRPSEEQPGKPTVGGLSLVKTGPKRAYVSAAIPYQITVTNQGAQPATNVTVTDSVPANATFVSATQNGQLTGARVRWSLGTLAPGESRAVELRLRGTTVGELSNAAEATADGGVQATSEARTEVLGAAGLLMMLVDTKDPIEVGGDTVYEIILRSQGSAPITNIRIGATVPVELAVTRVQGPVDHVKDGQKVTFAPLELPAGKDTVYRIHCKAVKSGDLRFRVQLTADQLTAGPLLEEESTTVYATNGKE